MISFVIPTKNEERVIEKTLQCISSYRGEKEIIVSDGNSEDNTVSLAKKYGRVIENKKNIRQTIGQGKNKGAQNAKGKYIVFIDADVYIPEIDIFLKKTLELFERDNKLSGITVSVRVFKEDETFTDKVIFSSMNFYHYLLNNFFKKGVAPGEFQMIRKEIFDKTGGYKEDIVASEDYEFFKRVSKIGKTFFAKNLTVYHTGRRAHKIGWPRLLTQWFLNSFFVSKFGKSYSKEWEVIR